MVRPRFVLLWSCIFLATGGPAQSQNNSVSFTGNLMDVFGNQEVKSSQGKDVTGVGGAEAVQVTTNGHIGDHLSHADDQDYEEFIETADDHFPWGLTIIIIGFLGQIGNLISVQVWRRLKVFNSTTFLLIALALCDFLFIIFIQLFHLGFIIGLEPSYAVDWVYEVVIYLSFVFQHQSVFITMLVSVTRYAAVKFPLKINIWVQKSTAQKLVLFTFVLSLLSAMPSSLVGCIFMYGAVRDEPSAINETGHFDYHDVQNSTRPPSPIPTTLIQTLMGNISDVNETLKNVTRNMDQSTPTVDDTSDYGYNDYDYTMTMIEVCAPLTSQYEQAVYLLSALFLNIIPWVITAPINFLLIHEVRKSFAKRTETLSVEQRDSRALDLTIAIITTVSIVAYPIMFLYQMLTNKLDHEYYFDAVPPLHVPERISSFMNSVQEILATLNSSLNFITYYACGKRFRNILHQDMCPACLCRPRVTARGDNRSNKDISGDKKSESSGTRVTTS